MQAPVERRQVEQAAGLLLDGVAQGVGQDQPALGVGVQDLDGLAVAHGEHVAQLHGPAAGHVLGQGQVADEVDRQARAGRRRCMVASTTAAPVMSHFMSSIEARRLEREPAGVERHPLADQGQRR